MDLVTDPLRIGTESPDASGVYLVLVPRTRLGLLFTMEAGTRTIFLAGILEQP